MLVTMLMDAGFDVIWNHISEAWTVFKHTVRQMTILFILFFLWHYFPQSLKIRHMPLIESILHLYESYFSL